MWQTTTRSTPIYKGNRDGRRQKHTSVPSLLTRNASEHRTLGAAVVASAPETYELSYRRRHFDWGERSNTIVSKLMMSLVHRGSKATIHGGSGRERPTNNSMYRPLLRVEGHNLSIEPARARCTLPGRQFARLTLIELDFRGRIGGRLCYRKIHQFSSNPAQFLGIDFLLVSYLESICQTRSRGFPAP